MVLASPKGEDVPICLKGQYEFLICLQTNKVERWTFNESGGINTDQLKEAEVIRWPSFDSRPISGLLYRQPARFSERRPV